MALLISIDGREPVPANNVVVYRDKVPVAVSCTMGEDVMYADALRDPEFGAILDTIGARAFTLPVKGPIIKGRMGI